MNVENILKVADAIEQASVPGLGFNMRIWKDATQYVHDLGGDRSGHNCGTVACIGGWTEAVFEKRAARDQRADSILDLDDNTAARLFYPTTDRNYNASPAKAVAVLRHLAATGRVSWSVKVATPSVLP